VELAEIRPRDDAVGSTVEGVAGRDGEFGNLVQLTGRGEVVRGFFDDVARQMVDLLLGVAKRGSADGGAVKLVRVPLQLAPALAPALEQPW